MREWLAFHLDVQGATKVVVYDDNRGRDGLRDVAAAFGDRVVIHDLAAMPELPADLVEPGRAVFGKRKVRVGEVLTQWNTSRSPYNEI